MEDSNKKVHPTRRKFFSSLFPAKQDVVSDKMNKSEMVKLLTADGKIVEVEKAVLEAATKNKKSSNQDIYQWMNNPSKEPNI